MIHQLHLNLKQKKIHEVLRELYWQSPASLQRKRIGD